MVTTGEDLAPAVREQLRQFFGAPIYDAYGMREVNEIAVQGACGSYHVQADRLWVEIVDDAGDSVSPGQEGEVVVTNLLSRSMPLLRYRTGDRGVLSASACECESPYPTLDRVAGRAHARIEFPDGGSVPASRLTWMLRANALERYQVVQDGSLAVSIVLRPAGAFDADLQRRIRDRANSLLEGRCEVEVFTTAQRDFVTTPSGKAVDFIRLPQANSGTPGGTV